ncbi:MAG: hypothetical protein FWE69_07455 [Clostridiales bacterium]|nr:hypothetical protein [Clostridiales bacterium]
MKNKKRQRFLSTALLLVLVALLLLSMFSACAPKEMTAEAAQELLTKGVWVMKILFFIQLSLVLGLLTAALVLAIIIMIRKWL